MNRTGVVGCTGVSVHGRMRGQNGAAPSERNCPWRRMSRVVDITHTSNHLMAHHTRSPARKKPRPNRAILCEGTALFAKQKTIRWLILVSIITARTFVKGSVVQSLRGWCRGKTLFY